jgi:hypothetical protein
MTNSAGKVLWPARLSYCGARYFSPLKVAKATETPGMVTVDPGLVAAGH